MIPKGHSVNVVLEPSDRSFRGELFIESSLRPEPSSGRKLDEYYIPNTILRISAGSEAILPVSKLSDYDLTITKTIPLARAWPCETAS